MTDITINNKKILLIISGGIAAYKALELIRLLQKAGAEVTGVLTKAGAEFITPLSVSALTGQKTYTDLFDLTDETEMGHINLSRAHDLIVIAPASADLMAKMAHGLANDLASTLLLASNKPVMICPAMNPEMWKNPATQDNIQTLRKRGFLFCGPAEGEMACGETGKGRMSEPEDILTEIKSFFRPKEQPLNGYSALITSGPTHEALDPVRFIGNYSSGKQGHALARALRDAGASVTLVTGPTRLSSPTGITAINVTSAQEMHDAVHGALPCDIAICAAAVADFRAESKASCKIKKQDGQDHLDLRLVRNPDILATLGQLPQTQRPNLVVGFAAETNDLLENAQKKLDNKNCDFIVANLVNPEKPVFGSEVNEVTILSDQGVEDNFTLQSKEEIAKKIVGVIIKRMQNNLNKELDNAAE